MNQYSTLDAAIDSAIQDHPDLFSISRKVRGRANVRVNSNKKAKTEHLVPITYVTFNTRLGKPKLVKLKALLDSGGSGTLVTKKYAAKLRQKTKGSNVQEWVTPAGTMSTQGTCRSRMIMHEFHEKRQIEWDFHIADDLGPYDMIIGRDMLTDLGIDLRFSDHTVYWDDSEISFRDRDDPNEQQSFALNIDDPISVEESMSANAIRANDYKAADLHQVTRDLKHLSSDKQDLLLDVLNRHESMFDGTLGTWKGTEYNIELKDDVKPYHAKAFPVPRIHYEVLKSEVTRLCEAGVLRKVNRSEWASPTFIIKKKSGSARFITDFRELNKRIRRKPYPIPRIQDMLQKLEGFSYASSIDLNMGYYHIALSTDASKLCTIVLPWGKYEYLKLPQGLCNSPDIFQEKMGELFEGFDEVRAYIDDVLLVTKGTYEEHLEKLHLVLDRLRKVGLKVNVDKSSFCTGELEYLGYWITREGIQPLPDKVKAIQLIAEPTNRKQLRSFIGMVNYYRDMWVRRSHVLAPLAKLTSKSVKWTWGETERKSFRDAKKIICRETMLAFPDFSKTFVIHTDASHMQLGAVISQDGKPIAFYSRKLNPAQTRYTTTERELLSIVETLKEFRNILLGYKIIVHTDHKNLTCKNFNTERVMRWRLVLEEYGPELRYIPGEKNIVADALSRLELETTVQELPDVKDLASMSECFANDAIVDNEVDDESYPLHIPNICKEQRADAALQELYLSSPNYSKKDFKSSDVTFKLIVYKGNKIVLPKPLQRRAVRWYHERLLHPGETRTELTIAQHYHWKGMREDVTEVCKKCDICQRTKKSQNRYGKLPVKSNNALVPWHTLCIDLIGPYKIGKGKKARTLFCLTMIDPATCWFECTYIDNKTSLEVANELEICWLTRYPWPTEVICDRGREFMGDVIKLLRGQYNFTRKLITTRNPQANSILERCHKTIQNQIRSMQIHSKDLDDFTGILTNVTKAINSTVHTTLQATPTQLVFGRDAFLPVSFEADWNYIGERKQRLIVQNNKRENAKRREHTYLVNDQVLILDKPSRKHGDDMYKGPYHVTEVYDNGTVQLQQQTPSGGLIYQTWNIRNIRPYKE